VRRIVHELSPTFARREAQKIQKGHAKVSVFVVLVFYCCVVGDGKSLLELIFSPGVLMMSAGMHDRNYYYLKFAFSL